MSTPAITVLPPSYVAGAGVAVAGLLALLLLPADTLAPILSGRMLGLHLLVELFAVVIAALVAVVSWHACVERRDRIGPMLAAGFAVVAVCDLLHALTYRGMPAVVHEPSTPEAIFFWLMGRTVQVLTLGGLAFGLGPLSRRAAAVVALALSALLIGVGTQRLGWFPATFVDGIGVTPFKAGYEVALFVLNLAVAALLWRRARRHGDQRLMPLAMSSFLMGIGELAFTSYHSPSDFQNLAGHLYKVAAYALLYHATLRDGIRQPYEALRASEAQLRESELRLRTLADNLPQCVIYQMVAELDGRRRFLHISEAVERVNGVKVADVLADPMRLYGQVLPEDLPLLQAAESRALGSREVFDVMLRMRVADGRVRRMHIVSASRLASDGRTLWDGTQTDVTEQVDAAESQRALEAQLREAQKMESIGTLASGIAHDFNNMLGSILGNAAMAREDVARGARDEALRSLQQLDRAAQRARELVRQILTFGRRQVSQRSVQPLQPVLAETLGMLGATLPALVVLETHFADAPVAALVDATQIQQVVMNLCTNAWQAMEGRPGRIEVGLGLESVTREAAASLGLPAGAYACLTVVDDGCGMEEATRLRAFEPFFTTKAPGAGTGLGLSVVHGIVRSHGGAIQVDSAPGRGTRFTIHLPLAEGPALAAPRPSVRPPAAVPAGRGRRVLLVDDDEVMRLTEERLLERAGHTVHGCADGEAALDALRAAPQDFELLVTDFNMPGGSGTELARAALRLRPDLAVVLVSGSVTDDLVAEAAALGIAAVVGKQDVREALAAAVESAMAEPALPG